MTRRKCVTVILSLGTLAWGAPLTGPRSLTVFKESGSVCVKDHHDRVLHKGKADSEDAQVLQWAVKAVAPGGQVRILTGRYVLQSTVVVDASTSITGEGRQTVLVPPKQDFALRVITTKNSPCPFGRLRPMEDGPCPFGRLRPMEGVVLSNFTIDGERAGKGIYLSHLASSTLKDLWIDYTFAGAGIYIDELVEETVFHNIHLWANGNAQKKEASLVIASQPSGDPNNNLRFEQLFVIFPNYIGVEIGAGLGQEMPRLITIDHAMFHGWHVVSEPSPYDLIHVRNLDPRRGMVIRDSRITNSGKDAGYLVVDKGDVKVFGNIFGGGAGKYFIRAGKEAKLTISGNTFHDVDGEASEDNNYALHSAGAEVFFSQNVLLKGAGLVWMAPGINSIVSQNRFLNPGRKPRVWIGGDGGEASVNMVVSENFFSGMSEEQAIGVSEKSRRSVKVRDNFFGR